jgi:hypothetical protein
MSRKKDAILLIVHKDMLAVKDDKKDTFLSFIFVKESLLFKHTHGQSAI